MGAEQHRVFQQHPDTEVRPAEQEEDDRGFENDHEIRAATAALMTDLNRAGETATGTMARILPARNPVQIGRIVNLHGNCHW
jgi:hypothetical protein